MDTTISSIINRQKVTAKVTAKVTVKVTVNQQKNHCLHQRKSVYYTIGTC